MDEKTVNVNKRKIYVTLLIVVICLIGVSYAFFTLYLRQSEENTITSLSCFSTTFTEETNAITLEKTYAVTETEGMSYSPFTFKIKNNCTDTIYAYITIDSLNEGTSTNLDSSHVRYNLSTKGTTDGTSATLKPSSTKKLDNGHNGYVIKTLALGSNEELEYDLRLWVDEKTTADEGLSKTWSGQVVIVSDAETPNSSWDLPGEGTLLAAIKSNNTVTAPTTTPGEEISADTEAVLASAKDDYGTSYYFRGAVTNNYVEYANMCWRIVRVTGDGSIKLVLYNYNGLTSTNNTPSSSTPCNVIGDTYAYARYENDSYSTTFNSFTDNTYIGFMYGDAAATSYAAAHANTNPSRVLIRLNSWYNNVLSKQTDFSDNQLADTIWCNDKSVVTDTSFAPYDEVVLGNNFGYGENNNYYSATKRLISPSGNAGGTGPSLICPNDNLGGKLSKFTVNDTEYGNGALKNYAKIGLLTADEVAFAGVTGSKENLTYYLKENTFYSSNTGISVGWWTLSPIQYPCDNLVWFVSKYNRLQRFRNNLTSVALRPSLSLVSNIKISSGIGTATNPYKIVME